jgi:hypothetical protein
VPHEVEVGLINKLLEPVHNAYPVKYT